MPRPTRIYVSFAFLTLAALACTLGATPPPDPGAISTAAAQTIIASLTGGAPFTATNTFVQPTLTLPTDTPTLIPTQVPLSTFTPLIPQISVTVATNCRSGPGKAYPKVGALKSGLFVDVYARDPSGNYWYIRNPDHANDFCWVWDEYAILTGSIAGVPMFTPPPTATSTATATFTQTPTVTATLKPGARFDFGYSGLETCKAKKQWWVEFVVKNTGNFPFRSMSVIVQDVKKNVTLSRTVDGFDSVKGCKPTAHLDKLAIGKSVVISSHAFPFNLSGRDLRAWVVLCLQPSQGGACVQKTVVFTP